MIKKSKNIKIVDETITSKEDKVITISKAKYLCDYVLEIEFDDGIIQIVDFAPFLTTSPHPEVKKYLNVLLFKDFIVKNGQLYWNDYDLIFPVTNLYNNDVKPYIPPKNDTFNSDVITLYHYWVSIQDDEKNVNDSTLYFRLKNKLHSIFDEISNVINHLNKEPTISILSLLLRNKMLSTNDILKESNIDEITFRSQIQWLKETNLIKCNYVDKIDYWELDEKRFSAIIEIPKKLEPKKEI